MTTTVQQAKRSRRPGWRDPRLVVGVVIMALSVLAGAWLAGSPDDTTTVLVARRDLPAGSTVANGDLAKRQVRLGAALQQRYLTGSVPSRRVLDKTIPAGDLVPRSALIDPGRAGRVEVPLSVATDDLPATVRPGSVVDVWAVPDADHGGQSGGRARLVLDGVTVLALADRADSLAPRSTRQVIVTLPSTDRDQLGAALGRATSGRLVLTRRD